MKSVRGKVFIFLAAGLVLMGFCSGLARQARAGESNEEAALFNAALARWNAESAAARAMNKPERGHHDRSFFTEFLTRWPNSRFADQAQLLLLEDSFCVTWAGYPDCGLLEVAAYNQWLRQFPGSPMREEVGLRRAAAYYEMAKLWLKGEGGRSERWSDLCRGQSLEAALRLKSSSKQEARGQAAQLEQKLAREFERPMAPIPPQLLDPDYN